MNIVDIGIFAIILLFTIIGIKRGVIKGLVSLLGIVVITIIAYTFKTPLANIIIKFMPFLNFSGIFAGTKAMNILLYNAIAFLIIFVLLYCLLSILLSAAGIIDKLIRLTVILAIPDRILGGLVGFVEGVVLAFAALFVLCQFTNTQSYVVESKYGMVFLERTPIVRTVLANTTLACEEINDVINKYKDLDDKKGMEVEIVNILIKYRIITTTDAQKLVDEGKIPLEYVTFDGSTTNA